MTDTTPSEIIANEIMWAKAKPTECNHALAKELTKALEASGYIIVSAEPTEEQQAAGARSTMRYPDGKREATCWVLLSDAGLDATALIDIYRAMTTVHKDTRA